MKSALKLATGAALAAVAFAAATAPAHANTLVSTIAGCYGCSYDTPSLNIGNSTAFDFTNAQMVLTGYQGDNNGVTETISLGTIAPGGSTVVWGTDPFAPGYLFTTDYDDEEIGTANIISNPGCTLGPTYCAFTGNFKVTFTAIWQNGGPGTPIFSQFSPTTNATGGFVGWEGLDPSGLSETSYDVHSGDLTGTLANIYVGTPGVPEPATWAMMIVGLGVLGVSMRASRRKLVPA